MREFHDDHNDFNEKEKAIASYQCIRILLRSHTAQHTDIHCCIQYCDNEDLAGRRIKEIFNFRSSSSIICNSVTQAGFSLKRDK